MKCNCYLIISFVEWWGLQSRNNKVLLMMLETRLSFNVCETGRHSLQQQLTHIQKSLDKLTGIKNSRLNRTFILHGIQFDKNKTLNANYLVFVRLLFPACHKHALWTNRENSSQKGQFFMLKFVLGSQITVTSWMSSEEEKCHCIMLRWKETTFSNSEILKWRHLSYKIK